MESFAAAIHALSEEAAWFARDHQARLLHVVTTADFRDVALGVLMGQEFHADNRSPFLRLDDAFTAAAPGWGERVARLREQHVARVESLLKGGMVMRPLSPERHERDALAGFSRQLRETADALPPPLQGLVIVLAPTRVEEPALWSGTLRSLLSAPGLADVRWIVVDLGAPTVADLVQALGPKGLAVNCVVDEAAMDREMADMLARAAATPPDAPGPAMMGAAWPTGVSPPARPGRRVLPPAELKAALIAAGVDPPLTPEEGTRLRTLLLSAVAALKARRGAEAVRLQREARDLCDALGMPKEAILMELILGSFLVQLGQRPLALETYEKAGARAEATALPKEAAQAQLAIAALRQVDRRPDLAAVAYARAGELAQRAEVPILAIESYRLAGQSCADVRVKVQLWQRALEIAAPLAPPARKASSAAETARALAASLHKLGLHPQAAEMERQSVLFESAEAAGAPPEAPATPIGQASRTA